MSWSSQSAMLVSWMALAAVGCGYVPQARFDAVQAQNRALLEHKKSDLAEIENLKTHARSVEDQLIKAESEVARAQRQNAQERQRLAAAGASGVALSGPLVSDAVSGRLADLSRRYQSLQYDAGTGLAKLDTDVLFDSGQTDLKPSAKKLLHDFADVFQTPEARDLKIMVVGHTDAAGIKGRETRSKYPTNWHLSAARALAVADALRKAGIPEERMGIVGYAAHQPALSDDSAAARQLNRRVEIYVVGPDTPLVGWSGAEHSARR